MRDTITKEQSVQLARRVFGESAILPLQELHQLSQAAYKLGYEAALAQPASEPAAVSGCVWTMDSDIGNTYATSCGQLWTLMDGSPEENRVKFCHNCGLPVLPAAQTGEPG